MRLFFLLGLLFGIAPTVYAQQDQTLDWFTYYGDSGVESGYELTVSSENEIFMAGISTSTFGMASTGAYQIVSSGGFNDAFLSKWSESGIRLWGTFYGGSDLEILTDIVALNDGSVVIVGRTHSNDNIATPNGYQTTKTVITAGYIAKFDTEGQIVWATYLSGSVFDRIDGVCADGEGNIIVTGSTNSPNMATPGALQTEITDGEDSDGFIAKYDTNGQLVWYTYYGAVGYDQIYDAAFDSDSNLVFIGYTKGTAGLASAGAAQESGTAKSLFLGKIDPLGNLIWCTYISGNEDERYADLEIGNNDEIIFMARTNSLSGISTEGAFQTENIDGTFCKFIAKYSSNGQKIWATYIGRYDLGLVYDGDISYANSSIYFASQAKVESQPLITGENPFQPQNNSANMGMFNKYDGLIMKFSDDGFPIWGTFFGGTGNDDVDRIVPLHGGIKFVITGGTMSIDFYADADSWQTDFDAESDCYLALLSDQTLSASAFRFSQHEISLYPNPAQNTIRLLWSPTYNSAANIRIVNLLGKTVYAQTAYQNGEPIDINLISGLYLVEITLNEGVLSKKLIIEK